MVCTHVQFVLYIYFLPLVHTRMRRVFLRDPRRSRRPSYSKCCCLRPTPFSYQFEMGQLTNSHQAAAHRPRRDSLDRGEMSVAAAGNTCAQLCNSLRPFTHLLPATTSPTSCSTDAIQASLAVVRRSSPHWAFRIGYLHAALPNVVKSRWYHRKTPESASTHLLHCMSFTEFFPPPLSPASMGPLLASHACLFSFLDHSRPPRLYAFG